MIIAVPGVTPFTTPDVSPTVATAVLLLLQEPPVVASVSVRVDPAHTFVVPLIGRIDVLDTDTV